MKVKQEDEREMEMLLDEFPLDTSPLLFTPHFPSERSSIGFTSPAARNEDWSMDEHGFLDGFRAISISNTLRASTPPFSIGNDNAGFHHYARTNLNFDKDVIEDSISLDSWKSPFDFAVKYVESTSHVDQSVNEEDFFHSVKCWDDLGYFHEARSYSNCHASEIDGSWFLTVENNVGSFDDEKSFIIEAKGINYLPRRQKHSQLVYRTSTQNVVSPIHPLMYHRLMDVEGFIYHLAKDQQGCRLLQSKLDEGKNQVDRIFIGVIDHVAELMVNHFGNYLMQKLLNVLDEEQRMRIILILTAYPDELIRISLNTHGTRAVQKLIETLTSKKQIALVVLALRPGFLKLIKDPNGNHVIQRCLLSLKMEENKHIFDVVFKSCIDIASHRHGCCVLQRCIEHSTGETQRQLITEVSANGLRLAQDPFGNYVVQYILNMRSPSVHASLASKFEGHYILLSKQKFSSNVVEKCLSVFGEDTRARIIKELLSFPRFEQLLQDPYANYVIQSALVNSKGYLHSLLVAAISPHAAALRTSPYSKRIFSRALPKKK